MTRTTTSTKPCLDEQRPGDSGGWEGAGLVEAALEGRLARHDGIYRARPRPLIPGERAPARVAGSVPVPLHVPDAEGQVPSVRLVEASRPDDALNPALRHRMIRAVSFLAVVLGALVLAEVLKP